MSEITLQQVIEAQNAFITAETEKIAQLQADNAEALQNLNSLANRTYGYSHEARAFLNLEEVYQEIISENSQLADKSAVGFNTVLHDGDEIKTYGNILYINGTLTENDYTFSGVNSESGNELAAIWYFENNGALDLSGSTSLTITDINIKGSAGTISLNADYTSYIDSAEIYNHIIDNSTVKSRLVYHSSPKAQVIQPFAKTIEFYGDFNMVIPVNNSSRTEKIILYSENITYNPYLSSEYGTPAVGRSGNGSNIWNGTLEMPNLINISASVGGNDKATFANINSIVLPSTLKTIVSNSVRNIINITLNCINATSIADGWCGSTPQNFVMASDWGATINISVAAASWSKQDFIDLFTNKLRDMEEDNREIKIPSAIYDSLTDEEFELAENKGWTVGTI